MRIWSSPGKRKEALPLLVVHDGAAYAREAKLPRFAARRLRPVHIALLDSPDRNEDYSASARYARRLTHDVLPSIEDRVAVAGKPIGIGASLGALALLHAERRHPGTFAGLFLQSGSYFVAQHDRHESGFRRWERIVRFVRQTRRAERAANPIPVTITCGKGEENIHNNRLMAEALSGQGYAVTLHEGPGMHDYDAWRADLDPHLIDLVNRSWDD